jgi:hypothetical protein
MSALCQKRTRYVNCPGISSVRTNVLIGAGKQVGMRTADNRNQVGWRRLTGWLGGYLLVLHVGFVGLTMGQFAARPFADETASGFTLCVNHPDGGNSLPADAPIHTGHFHCLLCAGGNYVALPPAQISNGAPLRFEVASQLRLTSEGPLQQSRSYLPNKPRAPPILI